MWTPTKIVYGTCEGPYLRIHNLDIINQERVDLRGVSLRHTVGIGLPTDFGPHYKLPLHCAMLINPHSPTAVSCMCQLCGEVRESILHWGDCKVLKPIYHFRQLLLDATWLTERGITSFSDA